AGSRMSSSSGRTRRTSGSGITCGSPEIAMTGWLALTSRGGPQDGRSRSHRLSTAGASPTIDEQRRPSSRARPANTDIAAGVAAEIAPGGELPTAVTPPHLPAKPGRIQAGLVETGTDEHVDHRVTVAQCDDLIAVAIIEQAQCRRPPRLGAQHSSSVSAQEGHPAAGPRSRRAAAGHPSAGAIR